MKRFVFWNLENVYVEKFLFSLNLGWKTFQFKMYLVSTDDSQIQWLKDEFNIAILHINRKQGNFNSWDWSLLKWLILLFSVTRISKKINHHALFQPPFYLALIIENYGANHKESFQAFLLINLILNHWEAMWKNGVIVNINCPFCFQLLFRDFTNNLKRKLYFPCLEE